MRSFKQLLMGLVTAAFLLGGIATITPFGSEAEAGGYHKKYKRVTNNDLAKDHRKIGRWLKKIEGMLEPSCPEGGEADASGRWVTYPEKSPEVVCDKNTGMFWEQSPSTNVIAWSPDGGATTPAQSHCEDLGTGWRLPEVKELLGLVDFSSVPDQGVALNAGPFDNIQSDVYWSTTIFTANPSHAWDVNFHFGGVTTHDKTSDFFVWCTRSGS